MIVSKICKFSIRIILYMLSYNCYVWCFSYVAELAFAGHSGSKGKGKE